EAMVVLARGSSHRTTADAELIRWGADVTRIEARAGTDEIEVALVRPGSAAAATGARKRIRVNGVARRAGTLAERLRVVLFRSEAMVVLARGSSHRTTADAELIRWGADVTRIEARAGTDEIEVALVRPGSAAAATGARKRIRVNGVARRAGTLAERLRVVLF